MSLAFSKLTFDRMKFLDAAQSRHRHPLPSVLRDEYLADEFIVIVKF